MARTLILSFIFYFLEERKRVRVNMNVDRPAFNIIFKDTEKTVWSLWWTSMSDLLHPSTNF